MFRYSLVVGVALSAALPACAGQWSDALFDEKGKDFGAVPRGPTLVHYFRVSNNTQQPVHIAGSRVSCGCTSTSVLKNDLAPGESTAILAQMDTRRFHGHKQVTIYVTFDRPGWDETQLFVRADGRDDIVVSPEGFNLGQVKKGASPSSTVTVTFLSPGWQIAEVERESNFVVTEVKPVNQAGSEASYQITASIRNDTPPGRWFTDVWLKTNVPGLQRVRIPLTVDVEAPVVASSKKPEPTTAKTEPTAEHK